MAENFGGPVWHASGRGASPKESRRIALDGLRGCGDAFIGQWEFHGTRDGIYHVQRRLTASEREAFAVPEPYDIRGTEEERLRIAAVIAESPYLAARLAALA